MTKWIQIFQFQVILKQNKLQAQIKTTFLFKRNIRKLCSKKFSSLQENREC